VSSVRCDDKGKKVIWASPSGLALIRKRDGPKGAIQHFWVTFNSIFGC
jgi:hypothetical protein